MHNDDEFEVVVVTCVYCGKEYPQGTPSHGANILTEHIKKCEKHPMRKLEEKVTKLRNALIRIVGSESIEELELSRTYIQLFDIPKDEKDAILNAIQVLIETANS